MSHVNSHAPVEEVLNPHDPRIDDLALKLGTHVQEALVLTVGAEAHDALYPGAIEPAAIEEHNLPRHGKVGHVALDVHLRLLATAGCWKRHHAEDLGALPCS